MSLTPAQVRIALVPLVRALVKSGVTVTDFAGIAENLGQIVVQTPVGVMPVQMPVTISPLLPLAAFLADAQARARVVMAPFETQVAAGFNRTARALQPGEPGMSVQDGWG